MASQMREKHHLHQFFPPYEIQSVSTKGKYLVWWLFFITAFTAAISIPILILILSIPLLIGEALLTVFAVLPLLLVPPVGYLVYWLVWKEFHA